MLLARLAREQRATALLLAALIALQSTFAALADLEVQFEIARDSLEEWSGSEDEKRPCCAVERAGRKGL